MSQKQIIGLSIELTWKIGLCKYVIGDGFTGEWIKSGQPPMEKSKFLIVIVIDRKTTNSAVNCTKVRVDEKHKEYMIGYIFSIENMKNVFFITKFHFKI